MRGRLAFGVVATAILLLAACSSSDSSLPKHATPRPADGSRDLTVVGMNVLHGAFCGDGDHCQAHDRIALLALQIEAARCPDVVALQEISSWMYELVQARVPTLCRGVYKVVFGREQAVDREMVLTRLPVLERDDHRLAGPLRTALHVRLRSAVGVIDLVDTHAGSDADNQGLGGLPCSSDACPPPCDPAGQMLVCQLRQVADLVEPERAGGGMTLVVGDLNVVAGSAPYQVLRDRGYLDTYLAAGGRECVPATGTGCTSGKRDYVLDDMRDAASKETERVDFILLAAGDRCSPRYDTGADADGDGVPTGLFADRPVADGPGDLAFPSDHVGTALDLACGREQLTR